MSEPRAASLDEYLAMLAVAPCSSPWAWPVGIVGILGCGYLLYSLPPKTQLWFLGTVTPFGPVGGAVAGAAGGFLTGTVSAKRLGGAAACVAMAASGRRRYISRG